MEIRADGSPHGRLVLMDGVEASHVDLADPTRLEFEYLRHLATVIDLARPRGRRLAALQVGGGPCTLARWLTATRPQARVTVVERDGALIDIARDWLDLRTSPRLRVVIGDGREEIRRCGGGSLDLLVIDAFVGRLVPLHLVTAEFVDEARRVLHPGGMHVVNLIDEPPLGYTAAVTATLLSRFEHVILMAHPQVLARRSSGNVVLVASDGPMPIDAITRRTARDACPWAVRSGRALRRLSAGAPTLADDASPALWQAVLGSLDHRGAREGT